MNYWKTMVSEHYEHIDYQQKHNRSKHNHQQRQQQQTNHKLFPNSNNIYNNNYPNDGRMGSSASTLLSSSSTSTLSNTSSNHQYHFHQQPQPEQITSGDSLVQVDVDSLSSPLSIKSINQIKLPNGQATTIVQDHYNSNNYYHQQHHHPNEQQEVKQVKLNSHSNNNNNNSLRSILKNVKAHNGHVTPSDQNSKSTNTTANKGISDLSQPKFGILKKTSKNFNSELSTSSNTNSINETEKILQAQCNGSVIRSHQDPSKTDIVATTATTTRKNPFQYFFKDNKKNVSLTNTIDNNNDNNNKPLVRFQMDPSLSPSSSLPSSASTTGSIAHTTTTTNSNNDQNLTTIPDINKSDHHLPDKQLPNIGASSDSGTVNEKAIASSEIVPLQLSVNYLQVPSSSSQTLPQTTTATSSSSPLSFASVVAQATATKSIHNNKRTTTSHVIDPQQPSSTTNLTLHQQPSKPKATGWNRFMLPSKSINNNGGQSSLTTFPSNQPPTTISTSSSRPSIASTNQASYYTTAGRVSDLRKILNPEVEKEDSFKKFTEAIENCDCFEFNLNNAAKLITIVVLLATFILVVKALKGDRL